MTDHRAETTTITTHRAAACAGHRARRRGRWAERERMLDALDPWALRIARGYARRPSDVDDLHQVARVGGIKAIDRFDPRRGTDLVAYALPTMRGEVRHYLRSTWAVHLPRELQELCTRLPGAEHDLLQELRRSPSDAELAERIGATIGQLGQARMALRATGTVSWDEGGPATQDERPQLHERVGSEDDRFERVENLAAVREAMRTLRPTERMALGMSYLGEHSQREIGEHLGCSQMQVSRLVRRALDELHDRLAA